MCGRTGLSLHRDQVQHACSYKSPGQQKFVIPEWLPEHNAGKEYTPSYNIAPTDVTPVYPVVSGSKFKNDLQNRVLKPMMWGVIPPWHKGSYKTHNLSTNNCRIENIRGSKLYNPLLMDGGRCVIVIEGFYEWQTTNKAAKVKQPYYIYALQDDKVEIDNPKTWHNSFDSDQGWSGVKLLHIAGLYHAWHEGDSVIYNYTVITMEASQSMDWLHLRMPAVLETEEKINAWLNIDEVSPDLALTYLKPVTTLTWHPVSTAVNNSRNKLDCNKKIVVKKETTQKTLNAWFSKEKRKSTDAHSDAKKFKT